MILASVYRDFWVKLQPVKIGGNSPTDCSHAGISLSLLYLFIMARSVKSFGWELTKARKSARLWKYYCLL